MALAKWLKWLLCFMVADSAAIQVSRLPTAVVPLRYEVTLLPVIEGNARLCGHVWIDLSIQATTNLVILHALNLKILQVVLHKAHNNSRTINTEDTVESACFVSGVEEEKLFSVDPDDLVDEIGMDKRSEVMAVLSKETLNPATTYRLGILYMGNVQEGEKRGFFRVKYTRDEDDVERWMGVTQFEATHARRVFPCFDEPRFKATFQLTVGHAKKNRALSNMPELSTAKFKTTDQWTWTRFGETPPMATYIVAYAVTELDYIETVHQSTFGRNVTIRLWSHGHRLNQLESSKQLVSKVLGRLESYIGVPYSLPKLDLIAVPFYGFFKAMENWGLIVLSESSVMFTESDERNPAIHKADSALTIAHELAHQYFGNLVTWHWWDEVWLNEGLPNFIENFVVNEVAAELNPDTLLWTSYHYCLKSDKTGASVSLNASLELFNSIESKFDILSYAKGGALFRMVKNFVGHDAFQSAINAYVSKFQFKNAYGRDLWDSVNKEARRAYSINERMNVGRIMNSWTQQSGFPLVTVSRSNNETIRVNQTPFYDDSYMLKENITSRFWWIPISIVTAEQRSFALKDLRPVAWLTPKKPSIEIEAPRSNFSWIVVNPELTGYYRVNYDDWLWRLISQQLMRDHNVIPPLTRARLIDDAFTLGHAKMIPYETALHLIEYMAYVDEVAHVRSAASIHITRLWSFATKGSSSPTLKSIVLRMRSIIARSIKSAALLRSSSSLQYLFENGPCESEDEHCISEALRLYRSVMASSFLTKDADQRVLSENAESVWCTALRHGGQSEWRFAWDRSSTNRTTTLEHKRIIRAMTCSRNLEHVTQLLSRMFHPVYNQKLMETSLILTQLSRDAALRPFVMRFVFRNLDFILRHFKYPAYFVNVMKSIIKRLDYEEERRLVEAFVFEHVSELGDVNAKDLLSALSD